MKRQHGLHMLGLLALMALLLIGPVHAQERRMQRPSPYGADRASAPNADWITEVVDGPGNFADMSSRSLALDSGGRPHIAYGGDGLYYAYHDGTVWITETVDPAPGVGTYAALGIDPSDLPHISYYDGINADLKYAHYDGSSWNVVVVADSISC